MHTQKKFLELFSSLEKIIKAESEQYDFSGFVKKVNQSKNPVVKNSKNRSMILMSAEIRNVIVHNSDYDILSITEEFIHQFDQLVKEIKNPKEVKDIMIPFNQATTCKKHESFWEVFEKMKQGNISNVPIIENDKVIGMFSESSLFLLTEALTQELVLDLSKDTVGDHLDKLHINNHPSLSYPFIPRKTNVYEALNLFIKDGYQKDKRTELLLVTINGLSTEPLQGIVSAYDLLSLLEN